MASPDPTAVIGRNPDIVETRVGDQTMMMSVSQGKYFALEKTGQRIWELIEQPRAIQDIVGELVQEYDVSDEDCLRDVSTFAGQLVDDGVAVLVPGA
ncbi:MAG: PqqD family peptide modification chaperone [Pseudomonadota bacterium]